jgi:hypothetical protein
MRAWGFLGVIAGIRVPDTKLELEDLKDYCGEAHEELESLEGVLRSVKGVGSDEERRGVLLRGVTKGKAAVEGTVRAVEKAIAAIYAVDYRPPSYSPYEADITDISRY